MGISALSLELSVCMCAHNYEVDVTANQVGQINQRIRVATGTRTLPPKHCCVPLSWFGSCCMIGQLDVVQSSCCHCAGNPVGHACWFLPLYLPSLPEPDLVVLYGKFREAQIGWTRLPARLLGLGFCFGQAIRFLWLFLKGVLWVVWICWWIDCTRSAWLTGRVSGRFSVDFSEHWVRSTMLEQRFLDCIKGTRPLWW